MVGLGLTALGVLTRDAGVSVTLALGLAELFGWGLYISRRAGRDLLHSVPAALLFTAFGFGIVLLKVAIGH